MRVDVFCLVSCVVCFVCLVSCVLCLVSMSSSVGVCVCFVYVCFVFLSLLAMRRDDCFLFVGSCLLCWVLLLCDDVRLFVWFSSL